MKLDKRLILLVSVLMFTSCGGGGSLEKDTGSLGGGNVSNNTAVNLSLDLLNLDGSEATDLSSSNPLQLQVQLTGDGSLGSRVVRFTLDNDQLANFDNQTNSAITDSNGLANIGLTVGSIQGAGVITAVISSTGGEDITETIGFFSAGDGVSQTINVASIDLIASTLRLPSSGKEVVEVTAIVSDENFVLLQGVEVAFQVSSGKLTIINAFSDENGQAKAQISSIVQKPNRLINVTARAANQTDQLQVEVVGTQISVSGPESMVQGDSAQLTAKLVDSDNNGIAGEYVRVSSSVGNSLSDINGNPIPAEGLITGSNGQVTVNYQADIFATDQISVTAFEQSNVSGALISSGSKTVDVLSDSFTLELTGIDGMDLDQPCSQNSCTESIKLTEQASLNLNWQAFAENVSSETVQFSTTRGTLFPATSSVTDGAGNIALTLTADNAGPAVITATGTRAGNGGDVTVSTQLNLEFIADDAETINLQVSKTSIAPDSDESNIIATVRDPKGNLVKGKTVQFRILSDTGNGAISPAEDITDSSGVANTTYTSNGVTGLDGVTIEASVKDEPAVNNQVNLTVADRELFIVVGTGNEIFDDVGVFEKPFRIFVTDVDSNPVTNKQLQVSAVPIHPLRGAAYYKGVWTARYDGSNFRVWEPTYPLLQGNPQGYPTFVDAADSLDRVVVDCYNEDININGILDLDVDDNDINETEPNNSFADNDGVPQFSEDYNQDGFVTPGNVAAVIGSLITDDNGMAEFSLSYPKNYAPWVVVNIIVSASVVGTESSTEMEYRLNYSSSYVLDEFTPPPPNPFGDNNVCSDTQ